MIIGWMAPTAICLALVVLAQLSRRLGSVTRTARYYLGLYVAAFLVGFSVVIWLLDLLSWISIQQSATWALLFTGLPTIGVTLGVVFAWRYWSWLLAERD